MSLFAPRRPTDIARFIREEILGIVTTADGQGYLSTPLPLIAECDQAGQVTAFIGHFARANPHVLRVANQPRAQISFLGPHGYIAPAMVSNPRWGPTWNYRFASFEVEITLEPERGAAAIGELVAMMEGTEPGAWTPQRMGDRFEALAQRVIAFRADVRDTRAIFKLGQDEDAATFNEIVSALGPSPLATAMREQSVAEQFL